MKLTKEQDKTLRGGKCPECGEKFPVSENDIIKQVKESPDGLCATVTCKKCGSKFNIPPQPSLSEKL